MARNRLQIKKLIVLLSVFSLFTRAAFFGFQFFTKTGIFFVPGVVYYVESLTEDEISKLKSIFTEEIVLNHDLKISAFESETRPELGENEVLTEILVPVAEYYTAESDVSELEADSVSEIPLEDLDFTKKLLSKNDKYFLDDFNAGATFRVLKFESDTFEDEIKPLITDLYKTFPEKDSVLSFAQTGVTALSRGMNAKLSQVGDARYFSEKIAGFLSGFDLTHTSNESSFSEGANSENICSDPRFIDTLNAIGLDIVELTGNHNEDCGDEAAKKSIDIYNQNNIKTVGGGKTAEEAAQPLILNEKGTSITFLAYNLSTGGATYDATPGANQYYEETAASDIQTAKERGDFVIVDVQYYECSAYASEYEDPTCDRADSAAGNQIGLFRHLIDLGADMVVGTSAHQPQTYELYGNGVIYYGLGNLFFDQIWWPGTTRSLILVNYFYNGKLLQTRIVPTIYDSNMQTKLLDKDTTKWFLQRLIKVKP